MEKLKPAQAVKLLHKKGLEVSPEQAIAILELLHLLAGILIEQYVGDESR